ncbi:hypothetical protein BPC006_I1510 [Burkholderia pseudomallei BPC006]|uniref:Uncharacterized protein n=1 Tax=Burkholderia pseudomallei (strain 1106a) TaxID=357348 RepID=A3NTR6_BURP0|nr:conserved hypothetical protein [Burkholderia pseudomallei 1106a]AFR15389.1 hypothetical protein BPC006_I1510 [Burkholderia pseudomallei BPC006]
MRAANRRLGGAFVASRGAAARFATQPKERRARRGAGASCCRAPRKTIIAGSPCHLVGPCHMREGHAGRRAGSSARAAPPGRARRPRRARATASAGSRRTWPACLFE